MDWNQTPPAPDLYFRRLQLGPMQNCAYLIGSIATRECLVVDPAWDIAAITDRANADEMRIIGAFLTHYHPDHVGGHLWGYDIEGVAELVGVLGIKAYAHKGDADGICQITGLSRSDLVVTDGGDEIPVRGLEIRAVHTPGHTPGSQCLWVKRPEAQGLMTGDTLFLTGCGRVDLPGGDGDALFQSLHGTLAKFDPTTEVFPGHHYDPSWSATLGEVIRTNPYMQADAAEFGEMRDGRRT